jgi:Co/Zn/Cd efflux system component
MAKNTSKKIKELKGVKPEKINEEELNKVQSVINNINRAQLEIGSFETKKHNMLHHVGSLQEQLSKMQVEFKKNYGTDDINIQDGTINYEKDEQTN